MHDRDLRRIGGMGARRKSSSAAASEPPLIALQRLAGNAAVAGLVGPPSIQRIWPFDDDEEEAEEAEPEQDEGEEAEDEEAADGGEEAPEVYPPGMAAWTGSAGPGRVNMVGWPLPGGSVSDTIAFAQASAIVHQVAVQYPDEPIPEDVTEGGSGELRFLWPGIGPVVPAGDTRDAVATDAMRFRSGGASPGIERIVLAPGAPGGGGSPGPGGGGSPPGGGGGAAGGGGGVPGGGIPGLEPVPGGGAGPAPGTAPGAPSSGGGPGIEPVIPGQAPGRPMLHVGSIGDAVREMQALLVRHGASIDPDGSFGRLTQRAVLEFQRRTGLDADGVVGRKTWGALEAG